MFYSLDANCQIRVACVGNSNSYDAGIEGRESLSYPAQMDKLLGKKWEVKNFGVSGSTLLRKGDKPYYKQAAFTDALQFNPEIVVIKLGTNDSKPQNQKVMDDFEKDYAWLIDTLQSLPTNPQILLCLPVPAYALRWGINDTMIVNKIIPAVKNVSKNKKIRTINLYKSFVGKGQFFPDKIHPNANGAALKAQIIAKEVKKTKVKKLEKKGVVIQFKKKGIYIVNN